jgi:hypothetical protein
VSSAFPHSARAGRCGSVAAKRALPPSDIRIMHHGHVDVVHHPATLPQAPALYCTITSARPLACALGTSWGFRQFSLTFGLSLLWSPFNNPIATAVRVVMHRSTLGTPGATRRSTYVDVRTSRDTHVRAARRSLPNIEFTVRYRCVFAEHACSECVMLRLHSPPNGQLLSLQLAQLSLSWHLVNDVDS